MEKIGHFFDGEDSSIKTFGASSCDHKNCLKPKYKDSKRFSIWFYT